MYVCLFMYVRNSIFTIIDSDNGLSPGRRQVIIWTNVGILLIKILGTNFSEILSEIHIFSFKEMHLKMSAKWWQFRLGLNVLIATGNYATNRHNCGCRCTDRSSPITMLYQRKRPTDTLVAADALTNYHLPMLWQRGRSICCNVVTEMRTNLYLCRVHKHINNAMMVPTTNSRGSRQRFMD